MKKKSKVLFGIDKFLKEKAYERFFSQRVALLCNQASVTEDLVPSYVIFKELFGKNFCFIFSPQHGLFAEKQANMVFSEDTIEPLTQTKVVSLYGPRLSPEKAQLYEVDVVFVDLQEVGCRVYTYIWTLFLLMKACEECNKKVVILDRPNPIGGKVEGPLLEEKYSSFVGLDVLPMRHGLTLGELALLFKKRHFKKLELEVIKLENYSKKLLWEDIKRPWIFPSPNLPMWESALVYPGMVLLEGTNLSEARGTTLPFLMFGAPYIDLKRCITIFKKAKIEEKFGVVLKPVCFEPMYDKWKGIPCKGFQIFVKNFKTFKPVIFALTLIKLVKENFDEFEFLPPPYEFERKKLPIEILVGNEKVLNWLYGEEFDLEEYLEYNLKNFREEVKDCLLYDY
ncbi:MAG: DUF1343 domain-containing protein [Thermodesulfobacteria bacterium]|nr:DUF1343 domain-containing protein [Thermodesulfobacteriota bacterium]